MTVRESRESLQIQFKLFNSIGQRTWIQKKGKWWKRNNLFMIKNPLIFNNWNLSPIKTERAKSSRGPSVRPIATTLLNNVRGESVVVSPSLSLVFLSRAVTVSVAVTWNAQFATEIKSQTQFRFFRGISHFHKWFISDLCPSSPPLFAICCCPTAPDDTALSGSRSADSRDNYGHRFRVVEFMKLFQWNRFNFRPKNTTQGRYQFL